MKNISVFYEVMLRINELKTELVQLRANNKTLFKENNELKKSLEEQKLKIETLKETNKIIKIAEGIHLSAEQKQGLKQQINQKIKLIDECIKLLSE